VLVTLVIPTSVLKRLDDDEIVGSKVILKPGAGSFSPMPSGYWGRENDYYMSRSNHVASTTKKYTIIGAYRHINYGLERIKNSDLDLYLLHSDAVEDRGKRLFLIWTTLEYACIRSSNHAQENVNATLEYVCDGTPRKKMSE
jgi:hypothetical protein